MSIPGWSRPWARRRPGPEATPWSNATAPSWNGKGGASGRSRWSAERTSSAWWDCTGCNRRSPALRVVEAGWRLHPDWWGHGYATEAAAASLHYGFTTGGLNDIVAFTAAVNLRSQAVMERIGMVREPDGDFDHPGVAEGSPLRRHVLYRSTPGHTRSHLRRTLIG